MKKEWLENGNKGIRGRGVWGGDQNGQGNEILNNSISAALFSCFDDK
jgi:hypothetical protein